MCFWKSTLSLSNRFQAQKWLNFRSQIDPNSTPKPSEISSRNLSWKCLDFGPQNDSKMSPKWLPNRSLGDPWAPQGHPRDPQDPPRPVQELPRAPWTQKRVKNNSKMTLKSLKINENIWNLRESMKSQWKINDLQPPSNLATQPPNHPTTQPPKH